MTKKLEELFDLPTEEEVEKSTDEIMDDVPLDAETEEQYKQALTLNQKINAAFPHLLDLETDKGMDDIIDKALDSYENLMDSGMNVDSRFSARLFEVAGQFLGHAFNAENAKTNKKLRVLEAQLKKLRIDNMSPKESEAEEAVGHVIDRNELIKKLQDSINTNNEDPGSN